MTNGARHRLMALLLGLTISLAGLCVVLLLKLTAQPSENELMDRALREPAIQQRVTARLAEQNRMPMDSHPDPDVARLLIAGLDRDGFRTNSIGMREREFELAKPPGTVRIVLLGDSFVFGLNVLAEHRLGVLLERHLGERAGPGAPRFEVLHYGVNSWGLVSECAFLRRQLDVLRPDLVIQITISNDLDDVSGVRGFGTESTFAPRHRQHADSIVLDRYARVFLAQDTRNFLSRGEDFESRSRFREALEAVRGLRALMKALPGSPAHVLVAHWGPLNPILREQLGAHLEPDSVLYTPLDFATDKEMWITPFDPHWSARGHEEMARMLYGLIRTRGLLPGLALEPWPEAEAMARDWARSGAEFAATPVEKVHATVEGRLAAIDCPGLDRNEARQVQGGLDVDGGVSPYCTLVLERRPDSARLALRGRALPEPALDGLVARVFLEEVELQPLELEAGSAFSREYTVPPELEGRRMLNLRFVSTDWVYRGADLRHCVSFMLERAALE
jgi:hypothetical protein